MKTSWYEFTSEPAVFLYSFSACSYSVVIRYFLLQKICSPDVEPPIGFTCNDTSLQLEANELMAVKNTWFQLLSVIPLLVAGCAKDATGLSKPMMYFGLAGEVTAVSIGLFSAWNWKMSAWSTTVFEAVVHGVAGGGKMFYLGVACVVTERSKPQQRTARLTLNLAAAASGACLASTISRLLVKQFGYQTSLISINVMYLLSLLLVIFIFEDRSKLVKSESWQFFGKLATLFKPRQNSKVIWLMVLCSAMTNATATAEENLFWNYMIKEFGFTYKHVVYFQTYQLIIRAASSLSLPLLLLSFLKNSSFKIGTICGMMAVISSIAMGLVGTKPLLLLSTYLSLCYVGQSILTGGFFYGYDAIFAATMKRIPGLFYFASAVVAVLLIILYRIAIYIYVSSENENEEEGITEDVDDLERCGNCFDRTAKY